jgi:transcriptional regulator with XRE-family HTH domain
MVRRKWFAMLDGMKRPRPQPRRQYRRTFIRQWRKHRDLTLEQLAEKIDMVPSHLSMLERGQRAYTQDTLEAIARALSTDVTALLSRDPGEPDLIGDLWRRADPAEREQIARVARALIKN